MNRLKLTERRRADATLWLAVLAGVHIAIGRVRIARLIVLGLIVNPWLGHVLRAGFAEHGYGPWALQVKGGAPFIGFCGIWSPRFEAHFTPCVEIGWRLGFAYWGQGYALESAAVALDYGFEGLGLEEIVAYTGPRNLRSRRVMERLGMTHDPADDFDHPLDPETFADRHHVLYRLRRGDWRRSVPAS